MATSPAAQLGRADRPQHRRHVPRRHGIAAPPRAGISLLSRHHEPGQRRVLLEERSRPPAADQRRHRQPAPPPAREPARPRPLFIRRTAMLRTPTVDKLRDLSLMGMVRAFEEQTANADYQALAFEERLGLMVDVELEERENRRLFRYLKSAKLRDNACIEDIDFHKSR